MKKTHLLLLLISLSLGSCYSTYGIKTISEESIMMLAPNTLEGVYQNRVPGDDQNSLWRDLCLHYPKKDRLGGLNSRVKITYDGDRMVYATLLEGNLEIDRMELPGKSKEKVFVTREGSYLLPTIIINLSQTKKTYLGNNDNGDLLIYQRYVPTHLLMSGNPEEEKIEAVYARLLDVLDLPTE